jgi:hypothetical protein
MRIREVAGVVSTELFLCSSLLYRKVPVGAAK